jgi:hypothetical protein
MREATRLATLDLAFLRDTDAPRELILFLYHSACRREQRGELDVAALLFYRLLEMISQHRLALRGISTAEPDYEQLADEAPARYAEAVQALFGDRAHTALPDKIPLVHGWLLLSALSDAVCSGLDLRQLQGAVESRNNSQFAHGFRPVDPELIRKLRVLVEGRLQVLEQRCGWPALADSAQEFLPARQVVFAPGA